MRTGATPRAPSLCSAVSLFPPPKVPSPPWGALGTWLGGGSGDSHGDPEGMQETSDTVLCRWAKEHHQATSSSSAPWAAQHPPAHGGDDAMCWGIPQPRAQGHPPFLLLYLGLLLSVSTQQAPGYGIMALAARGELSLDERGVGGGGTCKHPPPSPASLRALPDGHIWGAATSPRSQHKEAALCPAPSIPPAPYPGDVGADEGGGHSSLLASPWGTYSGTTLPNSPTQPRHHPRHRDP